MNRWTLRSGTNAVLFKAHTAGPVQYGLSTCSASVLTPIKFCLDNSFYTPTIFVIVASEPVAIPRYQLSVKSQPSLNEDDFRYSF